jgi:uncharacterized RDD family membrane protein YckC
MTDLSVGPPGWVPPIASSGPTSSVPEDRKRFDNARVLAYIVDSLLLFAVPGFALGVSDVPIDEAAIGFISLGSLSYFLVCEALWGQTAGKRLLGLRVVSADGGAASPRQVAWRTVLRVVDGLFLIGLIVMFASGRRRQRVGDLAARTVVVAAHPDPGRAARSPWVLLTGALWAAVCVALVLASGPSYAAQMQTACRDARAALSAAGHDPAKVAAAEEQNVRALAEISPPPDLAAAHRDLVALERSTLGASRSVVEAVERGSRPDPAAVEVLEAYVARAPATYAAVGVTGC